MISKIVIDMKLASAFGESSLKAMERAIPVVGAALPGSVISHKESGRAGSRPRYMSVQTQGPTSEAVATLKRALEGAGFKTSYKPRGYAGTHLSGRSCSLIFAR